VEHVLTAEATRWMRAADVAGVELPDEITQARTNMDRLEAEVAVLPAVEQVPTAAELAASGLTLDQATEEHARLTAEMARRKEALDAARPALGIARHRLSRLVAEHRDGLIVGVRPLVEAMIEKARPLAAELAPFAPKYDADAVVRRATPKQLKAYQAAAELEARFGTVMAAWRASFTASNKLGGLPSPSQVPGFDFRWVDQVHRYWERPEHVANPRLNGTYLNRSGYPVNIEPTILGLACESAEAGFRLATLHELRDAHEAAELARIAEARGVVARRTGRTGRGMAV